MRLILDIIKFPFVLAFYCMKFAIIVLANFFKLIFTPIFNLLKQLTKGNTVTNGYDFEYFCANLLRQKGFYNVKVTKASGDQGVDIIAYKKNKKYAIQCKYYNSPVGNKAIQEIYAGKAHFYCDKAIVMTNNTFTKSAKELAHSTNVELWDKIDTTKKPKIKKEHKKSNSIKPLSDKELNLAFIALSIILIGFAIYSVISNIKALKYVVIFAVILALTFFITKLKNGESAEEILVEEASILQDNNDLSLSNNTTNNSSNQDATIKDNIVYKSFKTKKPSDYELFELASKMNNQYEHDEEMQVFNQNNDVSNVEKTSQTEERDIINQVINELKERNN